MLVVLSMIIGVLVFSVSKHFASYYMAFRSGGKLKVAAKSIQILTGYRHNNYAEVYRMRVHAILRQCRNKSSDKKDAISKAIPLIKNYTDLIIFEKFSYSDEDFGIFGKLLDGYQNEASQYLRECGVDPKYISDDHCHETISLMSQINVDLISFGYPTIN